ncbi:MAG: DsbA family protein [Spirochaetota bacterium]
MTDDLNPAQPEIIYVFDGYCGWCWGISDVIGRLSREFGDRFRFSALSGGLITGERIGPLGDFSSYIEQAIPRVSQMTGAHFSEAYVARIRDRTTQQDSRIPAAVFAAVLASKPDTDTIRLAHDILTLNFTEGRDISRYEEYAGLIGSYGLDAAATIAALAEKSYLPAAEQQFAFARDIGAEAFPTIVYGRDGQFFPLCQGYQGYENLAHALDVLHKEPPEL